MTNKIAALTLLIIVTLVSRAQADGKYQVGVILPLTGSAAEPAGACRDAMMLGLNDLPPPVRDGINLIFEDNQLQAAKALTAYQKLQTEDKAKAIITWESSSSNTIAPLTERAGIVLLAVALDPRISAGRRYAFNFWVTPEGQAEAQINEALRRGYKRIARITALQDGVLALRTAFDRLNQNRLDVVLDEEVAMGSTDFKPFLIKLRARQVDAILVNLFIGAEIGRFAKQAQELGLRLPLFGPETFETMEALKISQGALVGSWYAQASDPSPAFLKEFHQRYPNASIYAVANCYDAAMMIGRALEQKKDFRDYLEQVRDYQGASGTYSATGDHRFTLPVVIKVVTKSGFENLVP